MPPAIRHDRTPPPGGKIEALRQLLSEKYPEAERRSPGWMTTGIPSVDDAEGGLRCGALTELTASPANGAVFMDQILRKICENRSFAALVDGGDTFDPDSFTDELLSRLLWIRCRDTAPAVKAADLIVRDGNFPLLLLDFQTLSAGQLSRIPASTWHRFQRLVEPTQIIFIILTRQRTVESAQVRISLHNRWTLQAQRRSRPELAALLEARVVSRRSVVPQGEGVSVPAFRSA